MHPGQLQANAFEVALIHSISTDNPAEGELLRTTVPQLRVLSRTFTGVGSFTTFHCEIAIPQLADKWLSLNRPIAMPGVPDGMGAILFCEGGKPKTLEVFTYGEQHGDGKHEGFVVQPR
jgi:hypothetical protein